MPWCRFLPGIGRTKCSPAVLFWTNGYYALKAYDRSFEQIIPWEDFDQVDQPHLIIPIFNFLNRFISNFGLIILLTIFINSSSLLLPSNHICLRLKCVCLNRRLKINAKYPKKDDAMKKQQETMALYKQALVDGGCWPMLFQMPILFAMFRFPDP